ncbi:MAG TPA: helix-turn-helix transcriptional regulator [Gaiellaceae bacterium]|nr:helix-turn-helix transcriptional regulator [Gaiellaceae bacterium]
MGGEETIGERLRRLREERGLAQRDVIAPGVSAQYISKIERGQRNASVKALRKLAENLGVSAQYLETGHDPAEIELRAFRLDDAELALRLGDDPAASAESFRTILAEAAASGDGAAATRARLGLGILAARHGDHEQAIELLEPAVATAWVTPLAHADAYTTLGHSYSSARRGDDAIALFRGCLDELLGGEPVTSAAVVRFATYLSFAYQDEGALDEAREALDLALRHGSEISDPYSAIRVHWAAARLAAHAGDYRTAQLGVARAISLLEATEDTVQLARAHLLGTEIALWDGDLETAAEHLEAAERILPGSPALQDRAGLRIQQAFVAARTGEAAIAIDLANEAVGFLGEREDAAIRGRAYWALGEAYAAAGAVASARKAFTEASELIPPGTKDADRLLEAWKRAVPAD